MDSDALLELLAKAVVLFTALPVHEFSHGFTSTLLGDPTPREQGRLTLNPFAHLSLLGSMMLLLMGFGWAKPVMVNPRYYKRPKLGMALTSLAGPLSNIVMALIAMIIFKTLNMTIPLLAPALSPLLDLFFVMVIINLQLAVFNLLPIPPLDGSKILGILLPDKIYRLVLTYERFVLFGVMALLWFGVLNKPLLFLTSWMFTFLDLLTQPYARVLLYFLESASMALGLGG